MNIMLEAQDSIYLHYTEWMIDIIFFLLVALAVQYLHISAQEDEEIGTDDDSDEHFP